MRSVCAPVIAASCTARCGRARHCAWSIEHAAAPLRAGAVAREALAQRRPPAASDRATGGRAAARRRARSPPGCSRRCCASSRVGQRRRAGCARKRCSDCVGDGVPAGTRPPAACTAPTARRSTGESTDRRRVEQRQRVARQARRLVGALGVAAEPEQVLRRCGWSPVGAARHEVVGAQGARQHRESVDRPVGQHPGVRGSCRRAASTPTAVVRVRPRASGRRAARASRRRRRRSRRRAASRRAAASAPLLQGGALRRRQVGLHREGVGVGVRCAPAARRADRRRGRCRITGSKAPWPPGAGNVGAPPCRPGRRAPPARPRPRRTTRCGSDGSGSRSPSRRRAIAGRKPLHRRRLEETRCRARWPPAPGRARTACSRPGTPSAESARSSSGSQKSSSRRRRIAVHALQPLAPS